MKDWILQLKPQDKITKILITILIITIIGCWGTMISSTVKTYRESIPLPNKFVTSNGQVVMTDNDIVTGKAGFQKADLMDYGSLYGMGSYFGEDFTAEYLSQLTQHTWEFLARKHFNKPYIQLTLPQRYWVHHITKQYLKEIDLTKNKVVLPEAVAKAIQQLQQKIATSLRSMDFAKGYTKAYSLTPKEALNTAKFLLYSSLTTVANRPGTQYSWTNNWPYQPESGNQPTTATFIWTWISITIMLFGIGLVVAIFRLYIDHETDKPKAILIPFQLPTKSQISLWKFFLFVALVFLLQILVGAIMAHYYADRVNFYGINITKWLPFAFARDVHIQAPIVWIGLSWIAAALFLAPLIGGREPKGQRFLVNLLFFASVTIVLGGLTGNYLGVMGDIHKNWFWLGNQGLSYIELGRFWQMLFFVGLIFWTLILFYAMWPTLYELIKHGRNVLSLFRMEHLLWYSALGVAVIYAFGMIPLTHIHPSFTITDFWRWWVVHLWVEWAFELFTSAITAYFLMAVGLVSRQLAERAVIFEWILILGSGILGTGHHLYWAGEPAIWIPIGSIFSFLEVLPLFLLVLEAIQQYTHLKNNQNFPYRLAFLYILGSAFWNFVGAGVFGGATINAPLVNYYEHGTFLTLNHAHTAMFGAFGLLAIGLVYLALRYLVGEQVRWGEKLGIWAFWCYNVGLVMWIILNFFPIGWEQLAAVYEHGYAYARSLSFYNTTLFWQWMRFPGDVVFAIGVILMAWDYVLKTRHLWFGKSKVDSKEPKS